ncbi:uncharacterized protein LOC114533008 [Dendronephthya gigantea]|uniref:uncharacterized protein LOC114533008 n=1 Tax=Dendronephthya gigantea TaxID=151771 RepID=UPI0010691485|nr:uncharacterized protein LOC114533008 [Dendronephthya gigantea]
MNIVAAKKGEDQKDAWKQQLKQRNGSADELEKIVEQTSKERLLLEKQVSSNVENLQEEIQDISAQNTRLANDNDILKEEVCKLQDFKSKHDTISTRVKEVQARNEKLENACSEKDKRLYKLEKQAFTAKNNALQKKNNELLSKVDQLNQVSTALHVSLAISGITCTQVERECSRLKEYSDIGKRESCDERGECEVKKRNQRLIRSQKGSRIWKKMDLEHQRENVLLKLGERDQEISSLYEILIFTSEVRFKTLPTWKKNSPYSWLSTIMIQCYILLTRTQKWSLLLKLEIICMFMEMSMGIVSTWVSS